MVRRLGTLYAKRIVNINVNIVVSGLLSLALTLATLQVSYHLGVERKWTIMGITFVSEIVYDVFIYYVLHWLANHLPQWLARRRGLAGAPEPHEPSFIRDATLVQFERTLLAPIYYGVAMVLMYVLLHEGVERTWAAAVSVTLGICSTRVLHTAWMLRNPAARAYACGSTPCAPAPPPAPPPPPVSPAPLAARSPITPVRAAPASDRTGRG